jgi:hypothetical protein
VQIAGAAMHEHQKITCSWHHSERQVSTSIAIVKVETPEPKDNIATVRSCKPLTCVVELLDGSTAGKRTNA